LLELFFLLFNLGVQNNLMVELGLPDLGAKFFNVLFDLAVVLKLLPLLLYRFTSDYMESAADVSALHC